MTLLETVEFIKVAHAGQVDKAGKPYWYHPVRVMLRLGENANEDMRHAALLHDVVEDTSFDLEHLRKLGYSDRTLEIVDGLTRREGESYKDFINRTIDSGVQCALVKLADLADNSSPSRMEGLPEEMKGIINRYIKAKETIYSSLPHLKDFGIIEGNLDVTKTVAFGF